MTTQERRRIYAAIGASVGMLNRYYDLEHPPKQFNWWMERLDNAVINFTTHHLPPFSRADVAAIRAKLDKFFSEMFPMNECPVIYMNWAIAIMDDLKIRNDRMAKILEIMTTILNMLEARHGKPKGVEAEAIGAAIADKWEVIWA